MDRLLLGRLRRLAEATAWKLDDVVLEAVRGLAWLWISLLAFHLALVHAPLPDRLQTLAARGVEVVFILSMTVAGMRFAAGAFTTYSANLPFGGRSTIVQNLLKVLIFCLGALVILQTEGISITPILTALGVGGLAVALALQDTLGNLFAGIHILMARHVRPGDYIRIDADHEGWVQDVGWRNTTVRTGGNSLVVVPNSKLAGAIIVNHSLPEPAVSLVVPVAVGYGSDLERVEAVLGDEARLVAEANPAAALLEPVPAARFSGFGDSGINLNVVIRCRDMDGFYAVRHALIKAIHRRLGREGIEMPFPTRTVRIIDDRPDPAGRPIARSPDRPVAG